MKLRLFAALLFFCFAAKAQTASTISPAHLKAAEDMLVASQAEMNFKAGVDLMLKQASNSMPEDRRVKFLDVMNKFATKYINWSSIKDQLAATYAQEFTEKELRDLSVFYASPLGKKFNQKQPIIVQKSALLGQQAVQGHQVELQQMMEEAFKDAKE